MAIAAKTWFLILLLCSCTGPRSGQSGSEVLCTPGIAGDQDCKTNLGSEYSCRKDGICVIPPPDLDADIDVDGPVDGVDGCLVQDDCTGVAADGTPEECLGPNEHRSCGIAPREGCGFAADCGVNTCHALEDSCSADGVGSECGAACVSGDNCGPDFRCGESGACEAIPCDEGFACPAHQVCDTASITADTLIWDRHHGCVDIACSGNSCGADFSCVNGVCQDAPGICTIPIAVP